MKPLALTMGDPAGISAEITLAAWRALRDGARAFAVLDDPSRYPPETTRVVESMADAASTFPLALPIMTNKLRAPVTLGQPDGMNAPAVIGSIERAVRLTLEGTSAGIVTNPISKATLTGAGFVYPGHTEFLANLTGAALPVMMLVNRHLRVVPVTIHVSLRRALDTLTTEAIIATSRICARALRDEFGIAAPRLAIAGLNPHAGESGTMGHEDTELIEPAITVLQSDGIDASGPWPPDTMFTPDARGRYDAAICMYHDQALIPLKTLDMTHGINITLGLPIIRTSPDHGTAFGIAGKGIADPSSLIAAIGLADSLASQRERRA